MGVAALLQLVEAYMSTWFPAGRISPSAEVALDCSIVIHHVLEINFYQVRARILPSRPLGITTTTTS
jgi:hypothetical protein